MKSLLLYLVLLCMIDALGFPVCPDGTGYAKQDTRMSPKEHIASLPPKTFTKGYVVSIYCI